MENVYHYPHFTDEAKLVKYRTANRWKIQVTSLGSLPPEPLLSLLLPLNFASRNQLHFLRKEQRQNEIVKLLTLFKLSSDNLETTYANLILLRRGLTKPEKKKIYAAHSSNLRTSNTVDQDRNI